MTATALVLAAGAAATIVDLRDRRVPNVLTMTVAAAGVGMAAAGLGSIGVGASLGGLALGLALMLPGHLLGATGAGDVKLMAAFGALLGPAGIVAAFLRAAIAGGVIALVVLISRGLAKQTIAHAALMAAAPSVGAAAVRNAANNRIPYAPALAIGAALVALGW